MPLPNTYSKFQAMPLPNTTVSFKQCPYLTPTDVPLSVKLDLRFVPGVLASLRSCCTLRCNLLPEPLGGGWLGAVSACLTIPTPGTSKFNPCEDADCLPGGL